ncbi:MAG: M56 family metallopeptidase, partial [Planctomyces sp.]
MSGALTVLTASTYRIQRFHKCVRGGVAADSVTEELVSEMAATLSLTASRPHVRLVDFTLPPLLWPIGRKPSIVLPLRWWEIVSLSERRTVVMHELIHWRRGDHWIRLLQWISSIAFWWHPVVWVARRELHRIEEQCCDAEVMHRLPGEGRAYASAMLSASQWLSEAAPDLSRHESSVLAMPMSYSDCFESFRRRIEMLPTLHHRPLRGPGLITILLTMSLPLSIGIGAHGQDSDPAQAGSQNDSSQSAVVTGTVTDTDGVPLAKAAVRVVIPAVDLRMYDIRRSALQNASREVLGHTDDLGKYSLQVPAITEQTTASIDILHPGHRRLSGTYRSGGDPNTLTLSPGKNVQFDVQLRKA